MHIRQPILKLDVLAPDGTSSSEHRVFCRYRQHSVPIRTCRACVHCDEIVAEPAPAVRCTVDREPVDCRPDPFGLRTAVGEMLESGSLVVEPGTTVGEALSLLHRGDHRSVAVVDEEHVLVGVVHESTFARALGAKHRVSLAADVALVMSGGLAIPEDTPIRRALALLASAHLREVMVVDDAGVPLGVFRDIDGLRWLVRARSRESTGA